MENNSIVHVRGMKMYRLGRVESIITDFGYGYMYLCMYVYSYTYIYLYMFIYVYICIYICIYVYIYLYIYTYIYKQIQMFYIYINIHQGAECGPDKDTSSGKIHKYQEDAISVNTFLEETHFETHHTYRYICICVFIYINISVYVYMCICIV
jgi:hypothetical protein